MYSRDKDGNVVSKGVFMHVAQKYHEKYESSSSSTCKDDVQEEVKICSNSKVTNVAVGSTNPVKVAAAKEGLEKAMANGVVVCEGFSSPSGVPDQPVGDEETRLGATNRAIHSYEAFKRAHDGTAPDYSIGLEGGIARSQYGMECFAYMVIYNGEKFGAARTCTFQLPDAIADLVDRGMELGDADDKVFSTVNSKQGQGTVGQLTKGIISRTAYYVDAVVLAYVPFNWPQFYPNKEDADCASLE